MPQKEGLSQKEIQDLIKQVRETPGATNRPVYGVNMDEMARAKNGGYPRHLYHSTLDPVIVDSEKEEEAVNKHGYTRDYKHRDFPCFVFRRNFDKRFAQSEFIEERTVQSREALEVLLRKPLSNAEKMTNCTPWVKTVHELPELEQGSNESPEVQIARLQEQLKNANELIEVKKR